MCRWQCLREVGHGEKGILIEHVALQEPLQQVPRHWLWRDCSTGGGALSEGLGAFGLGRTEGTTVQRHHASWDFDMNLGMGANVSHGGTDGRVSAGRVDS